MLRNRNAHMYCIYVPAYGISYMFVLRPGQSKSTKRPGRGAWVFAHRQCFEQAVSRKLFNAAFADIAPAQYLVRDDLAQFLEWRLSQQVQAVVGLALPPPKKMRTCY